ncbi:ATP-grasp domain-containing protein [Microlunatus aurantiacus]|uniref:ATP-grasp domain-containing protein n=1 Tax=Microlunatus aurantiacus TaxID=446786 RepID=A0ABP7D190_9ACTN
MVVAAFVAPYLLEATSRFVLSAARVPGVRLAVITTSAAEDLSPELREALAGHWQVADALDPQQIVDAVRGLSGQIGHVERLIGALEQLQVPLAQARDALGIEGMSADVATNVRDKSQMKTVLAGAGVPCARHQLVRRTEEAWAFRDLVGYPMVAKPPDGAGAKATFRLDADGDFDSWLTAAQQDAGEVWLLEEFLTGREHTFDSVTLGGETIWASISDYRPPPLEVLRTPWVQWTVLLPRDVSGPEYAAIRTIGPAALRALGVRDAFSHLEWFERPDGSVAISEVGARPPGAQLASMIGFSHEIDFYAASAELVLHGTFAAPERRYASGTAYLRGMGHGQVRTVHGIDRLQTEIGHLVVDSRLPPPGTPANSSYEGEGFITVRHPDTAVVEDALARIVATARVELVEGQ